MFEILILRYKQGCKDFQHPVYGRNDGLMYLDSVFIERTEDIGFWIARSGKKRLFYGGCKAQRMI